MPFDPYGNQAVANMLKNMNYFPGLGLGKRQQGIPEFPNFLTCELHFGLGYEPTDEDMTEAQSRNELKKRNGGHLRDWQMKPYFSLNGHFVKIGENCLYRKFPEPWYYPETKQWLPGFEIFDDVQVESDLLELDSIATQPDMEDYMESTLFEQISMITTEEAADPTSLIHPATGPLTNWEKEDSPSDLIEIESIPESESVDPIPVSLNFESFLDVIPSFDINKEVDLSPYTLCSLSPFNSDKHDADLIA